MSTAASESSLQNQKPQRVLSIDALRGFDMFWIIGGDELARRVLSRQGGGETANRLAEQFEHVAWEGFRFYDLIFPLFLFLVGCVLPYSLSKYADKPKAVYGRLFRRGALLVLFGLLVNSLLQFNWDTMRYAGVLQRIGVCYVIASLIYLHSSWKSQAGMLVGILLGYWMIMAWVPAPGGVAGDYSAAGNLSGYLDRTLLPGKIYETYYGFGDNEGILSTLPAVATTLLGVLAGLFLKSETTQWRKVMGLAVAGAACLLIGYSWDSVFPIIKNLWTSSFVLVAGGWSLLLLSLFYAVVDVLGFHKLAFFWVVIGVNAITIYVGQRFIDFYDMADFFFGGLVRLSGDGSPIVMAIGILAVKWLLLLFLFRNRLFLRV